jgi:hypothetical protein
MAATDLDVRARRGFAWALAGAAAVPGLVGVLVLAPEGLRTAIFLSGLVLIAAAGLRGGTLAWPAMMGATAHRVRAVVGTLLGLILGVTAAVFLFWILVFLTL